MPINHIRERARPAVRRGRPTGEQAAAINDRILRAAWELLLDEGPDSFAMERVAARAKASKRTLYDRFPGRIQLLQAVLDERLGQIFTAIRDLADDSDLEVVLADQARRVVLSMITPESRLLDRVVDVIDASLPGGGASPTRARIHARATSQIRNQLKQAMARWHFHIDDIDSAAGFWLDGLFGHARGLPAFELQEEAWALRYARYFLRAVRVSPERG